MGPLNGAKSTTLEGGIRVPLIMRWPGRIKPDSVSHQVSVTFDLTASFMNLAQAEVAQARLDGYDIVNHLTAPCEDIERTLFWRGKRGDRTWWGVRDGDLKYVRKTEADETMEWLYDLSTDTGEKNDLLKSRPAERASLRKLLSHWEVDVAPSR